MQQNLFASPVTEYRSQERPEEEPPAPAEEKPQAQPVDNSVQNVDNFPLPDHKILGEAFNTYIITEVGEQLVLIDKHAAHERMNFDRLKSGRQRPHPSTRLSPQSQNNGGGLHHKRRRTALGQRHG